jgi:hypothetical protein
LLNSSRFVKKHGRHRRLLFLIDSFCHHFTSVVVHVCKLFIFSSSSLKPLNRFGPNLAEMFIGRSSTRFVILVHIGNPTWLPGPIMCSDWLKLWKSSCQKLLSRWNCNIIEMMTGWSSTKFVIFVPIAYPRWPPQGNNSSPLDPMGISFKDLFWETTWQNEFFALCECSLYGSTPGLLFWCRSEIKHGCQGQ